VLQRLSLFADRFTLEAANAAATSDDIDVQTVLDCISSLVSKSLVTAHIAETATHYSLLHTTRAYAREKLTQSGELDEIARRHAMDVSRGAAKLRIVKSQDRDAHFSREQRADTALRHYVELPRRVARERLWNSLRECL
jgi:predicted ATPase